MFQATDVWGVNNTPYMAQSPATPPEGSQELLINHKEKEKRWSRGSDFLASTLAFSLSLHSLWVLPIVIAQQGGLVFVLIYSLMLLLLGWPLLMLEMFLG